MEFNLENDKGEKYALLWPLFSENETLKKDADEVGARSALEFSREEKTFRIYEAKIPDGVDVDKTFGRFATDEAKEAATKEREDFQAKKEAAAEMSGASVDEGNRYYPARANGHRKEFDQLRKDNEVTFGYRNGAFFHKDGPKEGFEKFQTEEAKKAWEAEAGTGKSVSQRRTENAAEGIDAIAERANGREFLADNVKGFMLPSTSQAQARESQLNAMKGASDEELAQVYKITQASLQAMERKQYGIQIKAVMAKEGDSFDKAAFNKMTVEDRTKAAEGARLSKEDFAKLVGIKNGFFAMNKEMKDRGLIQSRESAREMQREAGQSAGEEGRGTQSVGGKAADKQKAAEDKQVEGKKSGSRMANQLLAASEGVGR